MNTAQRNSNTFLQASSFNGGTIAQSFNLQRMRVIRAYANIIPPQYGYSSESNNSVFINTYDGSPLYLACGDVVLSAVIESYTSPIISVPNNATTVKISFAGLPTYNETYNIWEPGSTSSSIPFPYSYNSFSTDIISIQSLNEGYNINLDGYYYQVGYNTPLFYNNWINCVVNTNGDTITSPNPIVKLTLLVLNSFNA
jgi:hypothetical protein